MSCSQSADEPKAFLPNQFDLLLIITAALLYSRLFLNYSTDLLKDELARLYSKDYKSSHLTDRADRFCTICLHSYDIKGTVAILAAGGNAGNMQLGI